jgi:hypothetical protein
VAETEGHQQLPRAAGSLDTVKQASPIDLGALCGQQSIDIHQPGKFAPAMLAAMANQDA